MGRQPPDERIDAYVVGHLQEAFAADPRTDELGVQIAVAGDVVVLSGTVATPQRREALTAVARDVLSEHRVRNEVVVADLSEPPTMEELS